MIDVRHVEGAARRLQGIALRTPLLENAALNERAGGRVLLKPECLQRTGSDEIVIREAVGGVRRIAYVAATVGYRPCRISR